LQQILLNLILNAADAMDHQGEIVLELMLTVPRAHTVSPGAGGGLSLYRRARCRARDSCEILPRIFEPFFTTRLYPPGAARALTFQVIISQGNRLWADGRVQWSPTARPSSSMGRFPVESCFPRRENHHRPERV